MDATTIQTIVAVSTFVFLVAGGLIAYGMLKSRVNTLYHENEKKGAEISQIQRDFTNFREHTAQNYVTQVHISTLEERMARTEERLVGELRHMRETLVSALQELARKPRD